jgi:hypothetical protein
MLEVTRKERIEMDATKSNTQERDLFPTSLIEQVINDLADQVDTALEVINAPESISKAVGNLRYLTMLQGYTAETWEGPTDYETELADAVGAASWAALELAKI